MDYKLVTQSAPLVGNVFYVRSMIFCVVLSVHITLARKNNETQIMVPVPSCWYVITADHEIKNILEFAYLTNSGLVQSLISKRSLSK